MSVDRSTAHATRNSIINCNHSEFAVLKESNLVAVTRISKWEISAKMKQFPKRKYLQSAFRMLRYEQVFDFSVTELSNDGNSGQKPTISERTLLDVSFVTAVLEQLGLSTQFGGSLPRLNFAGFYGIP
jgi:hypothetical protein